MKNWNLSNKKALVTEGSNRIGQAVVRELLSLGAEVLFTGRNQDDLQNAYRLLDSDQRRSCFIRGNVVDAGHRDEVAAWISERWGCLDLVVNNVGINIRKPSNDYTTEECLEVINANLLAPFDFCRVLFPLLQKSKQASIINIATVAGSCDVQTGAPYGMAKAGLIQLTSSLASEWATFGISVNSVSPWFTETPRRRDLLEQAEKLKRTKNKTPLNRIALGEEIAAAVVFLAMDKASYITGQNISVDGGITTR